MIIRKSSQRNHAIFIGDNVSAEHWAYTLFVFDELTRTLFS